MRAFRINGNNATIEDPNSTTRTYIGARFADHDAYEDHGYQSPADAHITQPDVLLQHNTGAAFRIRLHLAWNRDSFNCRVRG